MRIMRVVITIIINVVHHHYWTAVVVQRTPTDIIVSPVPVHPAGSPKPGRNPIPTKTPSPVPSTVMVHRPSPGVIRNPIPTNNRIPDPSSVIIGSPFVMIDLRNPNIAVGPFIDPSSMKSQFCFIFRELCRKISFRNPPIDKRISVFTPLVETVLKVSVKNGGTRTKTSVLNNQSLLFFDQKGALFSSSLHGPAIDQKLSLLFFSYIQAVKTLS